jgi:uncharacterized protein YlaI
MKCVICHSEDILEENVMEEFKHGNDVIFVPIRTMVCSSCGECGKVAVFRTQMRKTNRQAPYIQAQKSLIYFIQKLFPLGTHGAILILWKRFLTGMMRRIPN